MSKNNKSQNKPVYKFLWLSAGYNGRYGIWKHVPIKLTNAEGDSSQNKHSKELNSWFSETTFQKFEWLI